MVPLDNDPFCALQEAAKAAEAEALKKQLEEAAAAKLALDKQLADAAAAKAELEAKHAALDDELK